MSQGSRLDNEMLRSVRSVARPKFDGAALETLHIGFTAMASLFALMVGFWGFGSGRPIRGGGAPPTDPSLVLGFGMALGFAFLNLVALLLGRSIRLVLSDFYRQFQYREKFALFLAHALVFFAPWLLLRLPGWSVPMALLLIMLSVQSIDAVFYGRVYAVTMFLTVFGIYKGGFGNPMPPAAMVAAYFLFLLLAFRFGHLRFRLEAEGGGLGVDMGETLLQTCLPALAPPTIGLMVYTITARYLFPRQWAFRLNPSTPPTAPVHNMANVFWQALGTVALIVACLVMLAWLEQQLRGKGKGKAEEPDAIGATARALEEEAVAMSRAQEEKATGPRERILLAFRKFARTRGRDQAETAEAFLARILPDQKTAAELFNDACYDRRTLTDEDAEAFERALG